MSEERVLERLREREGNKTTRSGRGLAMFAVLVALAALGLAGYPYYQKMVHGVVGDSTPAPAGDTQTRDVAELRRAFDAAVASLDDRLLQQQLRQTTRLDEQDTRIAASAHSPADDAATAASTTRLADTFKLTEAQYLLQGADNRLQLQGDGAGALGMMLAAQQVLADVDTPAVRSVLAKLNDEVAQLRGDPGVDVNVVFLRLEKLKQNLPESPVGGVGFTAGNLPATETTPASIWQQVVRKFMSLFEFRHNAGDGQRPLTVDEVDRLRLNLELLLQTAQISLLRNDAVGYTESLTAARAALDAYRANNSDKAAGAQAEIDQLLALPLHRTLAEVSGSLTELRGVLGATTPQLPPQATSAPETAAQAQTPAPVPEPSPPQ